MAKLTKRIVDAADIREKDYFIWDDELPGFGLRHGSHQTLNGAVDRPAEK